MKKKTSAGLLISALMAMLVFAALSEVGRFDPQCMTRDCMPECLKLPTASPNACQRSCDEYCHEIAGRGNGPPLFGQPKLE